MKVMPPYCVALRACLPYCVPPTIRKVAQIVHADSHAADTSAPVACGYFSQEANASEPAPWHKESSGTLLSDALIDGRVGVKDIESFRVFLFEGDGQWYSLSNRILCAVKAYVYHSPHAVAMQHLLAVTHPPSRLGSIAAQQTPPQSARWMVLRSTRSLDSSEASAVQCLLHGRLTSYRASQFIHMQPR